MLKYANYDIVTAEVPDEITLAISISNCPNHCPGCHSSFLADDIGLPLDNAVLKELIDNNQGITCVAIMGGDADIQGVISAVSFIKKNYPDLKTCWYSGRISLPTEIDDKLGYFDYFKLGPYIAEFGGLDNPKTNQRFYHHDLISDTITDITSRFFKS